MLKLDLFADLGRKHFSDKYIILVKQYSNVCLTVFLYYFSCISAYTITVNRTSTIYAISVALGTNHDIRPALGDAGPKLEQIKSAVCCFMYLNSRGASKRGPIGSNWSNWLRPTLIRFHLKGPHRVT